MKRQPFLSPIHFLIVVMNNSLKNVNVIFRISLCGYKVQHVLLRKIKEPILTDKCVHIYVNYCLFIIGKFHSHNEYIKKTRNVLITQGSVILFHIFYNTEICRNIVNSRVIQLRSYIYISI